MAEVTGIEWCDSTWSAWIGCTKVSTAAAGGGACDHCYAEALNKRFSGSKNWGPGAPRRRTSDANWRVPISWNRNSISFGLEHGRNRRVFLNNQADIFDNEVDNELRNEVFALIEATPNLDWLMLTKRIGNARKMLPAVWLESGGWPKNVRLGITICNEAEAVRDVRKLLELHVPNFLSIEPLLGPIDWYAVSDAWFKAGCKPWANAPILTGIDWMIVGGESGVGARPMHPGWVRSLRDQCAAAGVPFLFKQWGEWAPLDANAPMSMSATKSEARVFIDTDSRGFQRHGPSVDRVGKKAAGRELDGVLHDGYPRRQRAAARFERARA